MSAGVSSEIAAGESAAEPLGFAIKAGWAFEISNES
jgi:hypothetical protein